MLSDLMWMTEDNNMRASDELLFKMLTFASYGTEERKKNLKLIPEFAPSTFSSKTT